MKPGPADTPARKIAEWLEANPLEVLSYRDIAEVYGLRADQVHAVSNYLKRKGVICTGNVMWLNPERKR